MCITKLTYDVNVTLLMEWFIIYKMMILSFSTPYFISAPSIREMYKLFIN